MAGITKQQALDLAVFKAQGPLFELLLLAESFDIRDFKLQVGNWTVSAELPRVQAVPPGVTVEKPEEK